MKDLAVLHRQSLDICSVREFLDYPETFRMEEGVPLAPDLNLSYEIELRDVSFRYPEAEKGYALPYQPEDQAWGKAGHCGSERCRKNHID